MAATIVRAGLWNAGDSTAGGAPPPQLPALRTAWAAFGLEQRAGETWAAFLTRVDTAMRRTPGE